MLKRLFAIAGLFFILIAAAAAGVVEERRLLKLVPAGAEVIVSANVAHWLELPALKEGLLKSRDMAEMSRKTGLQIGDLKAAVFWMKGKEWTLLTAWRKPFKPMRVFQAPFFACGKVQVGGETLFSVNSVKKIPAKEHNVRKKKKPVNVSFWCSEMPGNCAAFFPDSAAALNSLKEMKGKNCGFAFPMQVSGAFRGIVKEVKEFPVKGAFFSCRMTGKKKSDLSGLLSVTVRQAAEAENLKNQCMMMLNLMLIQSMQEDPQLAADLVRCLNFSTAGSAVILKANIPADILKRLGVFASAQAKKRKAVRAAGEKNPSVQKPAASNK